MANLLLFLIIVSFYCLILFSFQDQACSKRRIRNFRELIFDAMVIRTLIQIIMITEIYFYGINSSDNIIYFYYLLEVQYRQTEKSFSKDINCIPYFAITQNSPCEFVVIHSVSGSSPSAAKTAYRLQNFGNKRIVRDHGYSQIMNWQ